MFGIDLVYMAIVFGGMGLSMLASFFVKKKFADGQNVPLRSRMTGEQIAKAILRSAGVTDVQVVEHAGFLSDHYNPMSKTLALSSEVFHGTNASSAGVAAHEVGHALQHAKGYAPMWMRSAVVPVANIGSMVGPWIIIAGVALGAAQQIGGLGYYLAILGVILFAAATFFTVITVPVEFDASHRAKKELERMEIIRTQEEMDAVKGVLTAAGMTYVAAAVASVAQLLYWMAKAGLLGGRRSDD
jgi:Zn-dependent membrane protease YugP